MSLEKKIAELTTAVEKLTDTLETCRSVAWVGVDMGAKEDMKDFTEQAPTNIDLNLTEKKETTLKSSLVKQVTPPPIKKESESTEPDTNVAAPPVEKESEIVELINAEQAAKIVERMKVVGTNLGNNEPIWNIIHSYGVTSVSMLPAKHANDMLAKLDKL